MRKLQRFDGEILRVASDTTAIVCDGATDLSPLAGLSGLQELFCNSATDLTPLVGMHNLRFIACQNASDLSPLYGLQGLSSLHHKDGHISGDKLKIFMQNESASFAFSEMNPPNPPLVNQLQILIADGMDANAQDIVGVLVRMGDEGEIVPPEMQDALMGHEYMIVRKAVIEAESKVNPPGRRPELTEKALTDDAFSVRVAGVEAASTSLTPRQLDRALNDESNVVRLAAFDLALTNESSIVRLAAIKGYFTANSVAHAFSDELNIELTDDLVSKMLLDAEPVNQACAYQALLSVGKLPHAQIVSGRSNGNPVIRAICYTAGDLSKIDIETGLTDESPDVRRQVIRHSLLTTLSPEQVERALVDENPYVRAYTVEKGGLNEIQLDRAILDNDGMVRLSAFKHGGLTDKQLDAAISLPAPQLVYASTYQRGLDKLAQDISNEVSRQKNVISVIDLAWEKHGVVVDRNQLNDTFAHRLNDQVCTGKILDVIPERGVALLSRGCGKAMVLDLKDFEDRLPVKGSMEKMVFKGGRVQQDMGQEQGRDAGKSVGGR